MGTDDEELDNAAINDAISRAAQTTSFAERLLADGQPVVYLDEDGAMITRLPDGTRETTVPPGQGRSLDP